MKDALPRAECVCVSLRRLVSYKWEYLSARQSSRRKDDSLVNFLSSDYHFLCYVTDGHYLQFPGVV